VASGLLNDEDVKIAGRDARHVNAGRVDGAAARSADAGGEHHHSASVRRAGHQHHHRSAEIARGLGPSPLNASLPDTVMPAAARAPRRNVLAVDGDFGHRPQFKFIVMAVRRLRGGPRRDRRHRVRQVPLVPVPVGRGR
jgi:hypothetical protein